MDESAPTYPDTVYGETKLHAEGIVLSTRNAAGEPIIAVQDCDSELMLVVQEE